MTDEDPDEQRSVTRETWEQAARGWGARADRIRDWGMPVSVAMLDGLALSPGERVLELAAGPGDTGFLAAEQIMPGGTLISSDGAEAMVEVARARAAQAGIANAEFRTLELEWIDLAAASVDAILCRWGIMLIVDPSAAAREIRRVLRPGGRAALAVWDLPEANPWATIANRALVELGYGKPPDLDAPGPFRLSAGGQLTELLHDAGFTDVEVRPVALERRYTDVQQYIAETIDMSPSFNGFYERLDSDRRAAVAGRIAQQAEALRGADGVVVLPGSSLVAIAS